ncbi:protein TONSOKU-like [Prunus dulcis]|uniref:protein TONSOKU-like n=1 Tax=Prunus dulcis TaxID=3755 RepID=UPI001481E53D|nr:protein TONSOKU-like [Prunus dulcis]XP_034219751.1 protein TONSOKU-like [Prunus dulcis]
MICGILELNLSGNPIMQEGSNVLSSMLSNSQCCLKVLVLQRCELGVAGVLRISFLEELNLADNANLWRYRYPRKLILLNRVQQLGLNLVIVKMMKLELKLLHLVSMTAA